MAGGAGRDRVEVTGRAGPVRRRPAVQTARSVRVRSTPMLYGVPTWGFAMMWLALAAAITVRTARRGLPFALTWWSFTFPVGTCVTGTIALAARSGADVLRIASVVLFALLVAAWLVVAARTVAGSASGRLFKPV
jgi:tellurite resistance protein TehA-like permease